MFSRAGFLLKIEQPHTEEVGKKSIPKSITFLMPLAIDFWMNFGDVGFQNGVKLASKWE